MITRFLRITFGSFNPTNLVLFFWLAKRVTIDRNDGVKTCTSAPETTHDYSVFHILGLVVKGDSRNRVKAESNIRANEEMCRQETQVRNRLLYCENSKLTRRITTGFQENCCFELNSNTNTIKELYSSQDKQSFISWSNRLPNIGQSINYKGFWKQRPHDVLKINCKVLTRCWISCFRDACNRRHSRCILTRSGCRATKTSFLDRFNSNHVV